MDDYEIELLNMSLEEMEAIANGEEQEGEGDKDSPSIRLDPAKAS